MAGVGERGHVTVQRYSIHGGQEGVGSGFPSPFKGMPPVTYFLSPGPAYTPYNGAVG